MISISTENDLIQKTIGSPCSIADKSRLHVDGVCRFAEKLRETSKKDFFFVVGRFMSGAKLAYFCLT